MRDRDVEIRDRAMALLGVSSLYDTTTIRRNFLRQLRLVHPDGPRRHDRNVPGFDNTEVARLLIQAYGHLMGRRCPTTMIENDALVGILLNGRITPLAETRGYTKWHAGQFYDQFRQSIWPDLPAAEIEIRNRYRFKGV